MTKWVFPFAVLAGDQLRNVWWLHSENTGTWK